jgi:IS5 family transposase
MQQWFTLSDPDVEEAFYESATLRCFAGVDLGVASAPDETTVLRFRHLLEKHNLCGAMLDAVNLHLEANGIKVQTGTNCRPCNKLPSHANVIHDCETLRAAGWLGGGSHKSNVTGGGGTTQQGRSMTSS